MGRTHNGLGEYRICARLHSQVGVVKVDSVDSSPLSRRFVVSSEIGAPLTVATLITIARPATLVAPALWLVQVALEYAITQWTTDHVSCSPRSELTFLIINRLVELILRALSDFAARGLAGKLRCKVTRRICADSTIT